MGTDAARAALDFRMTALEAEKQAFLDGMTGMDPRIAARRARVLSEASDALAAEYEAWMREDVPLPR